jgi:hypothetical protein
MAESKKITSRIVLAIIVLMPVNEQESMFYWNITVRLYI